MKIIELLYPDPSTLTFPAWHFKRFPKAKRGNFVRIMLCLAYCSFWAVLMSLCLSILFVVRPSDAWEIVHIYDILDPVVHSISTLYFLYFFGYVYVHVDRKADPALCELDLKSGGNIFGPNKPLKGKRVIFICAFMLCIFGGGLSMIGTLAYEVYEDPLIGVFHSFFLDGESAFHILTNLIFASLMATLLMLLCFYPLTMAWYHSLPVDRNVS